MYSRISLVLVVLAALTVGPAFGFTNAFNYTNQGTDWTLGFCNETTYLKQAIQQSPVAINTSNVTIFASIHYWFPFYKPTPAKVTFYNVSCVVTTDDPKGLGWVYAAQSDFNRNQEKATNITIHSPAEHIIDGKQYPIEIQITHEAVGKFLTIGASTVVSIFFDNETSSNPSELLANISSAKAAGTGDVQIDLSTIFDPRLTNLLDSYSYSGTFTMPTCEPFVTYVVYPKPYSASSEQIQMFWDLYHNNTNFTGNGNNRAVFNLTQKPKWMRASPNPGTA